MSLRERNHSPALVGLSMALVSLVAIACVSVAPPLSSSSSSSSPSVSVAADTPTPLPTAKSTPRPCVAGDTRPRCQTAAPPTTAPSEYLSPNRRRPARPDPNGVANAHANRVSNSNSDAPRKSNREHGRCPHGRRDRYPPNRLRHRRRRQHRRADLGDAHQHRGLAVRPDQHLRRGAAVAGVQRLAELPGHDAAGRGSCTVNYTFSPTAAGYASDFSAFTISQTSSQSDGEDFTVAIYGCGDHC